MPINSGLLKAAKTAAQSASDRAIIYLYEYSDNMPEGNRNLATAWYKKSGLENAIHAAKGAHTQSEQDRILRDFTTSANTIVAQLDQIAGRTSTITAEEAKLAVEAAATASLAASAHVTTLAPAAAAGHVELTAAAGHVESAAASAHAAAPAHAAASAHVALDDAPAPGSTGGDKDSSDSDEEEDAPLAADSSDSTSTERETASVVTEVAAHLAPPVATTLLAAPAPALVTTPAVTTAGAPVAALTAEAASTPAPVSVTTPAVTTAGAPVAALTAETPSTTTGTDAAILDGTTRGTDGDAAMLTGTAGDAELPFIGPILRAASVQPKKLPINWKHVVIFGATIATVGAISAFLFVPSFAVLTTSLIVAAKALIISGLSIIANGIIAGAIATKTLAVSGLAVAAKGAIVGFNAALASIQALGHMFMPSVSNAVAGIAGTTAVTLVASVVASAAMGVTMLVKHFRKAPGAGDVPPPGTVIAPAVVIGDDHDATFAFDTAAPGAAPLETSEALAPEALASEPAATTTTPAQRNLLLRAFDHAIGRVQSLVGKTEAAAPASVLAADSDTEERRPALGHS